MKTKFKDMLNEKQTDFEFDIMQIAKMTDNNDHTGALSYLAKLMKNKMYMKVLDGMEMINKAYGSTPSEIIKLRDGKNGVADELLRLAKRKYSKEDYALIHGSF